MNHRNKDSKSAMGMIPATALVLITLIVTVGAVEITISVVSPSAQRNPIATGSPASQGTGINSSQPSGGGVQAKILAGSSTNMSTPGFSPDVIVVVFGLNNTVTWTNGDTVSHSIVSDSMGFN